MRHPYPDAPSPETRRARWIRRAIIAVQTLIFLWALLSQIVGGHTETDDSTHPANTDRAAAIQTFQAEAPVSEVTTADVQQMPSLYLVDTAVQVTDSPSGQPDEGRQHTQSPRHLPMSGCGGMK